MHISIKKTAAGLILTATDRAFQCVHFFPCHMIAYFFFIACLILAYSHTRFICCKLPVTICMTGCRNLDSFYSCIGFSISGNCCCVIDTAVFFTGRAFLLFCDHSLLCHRVLTVFTAEAALCTHTSCSVFRPVHAKELIGMLLFLCRRRSFCGFIRQWISVCSNCLMPDGRLCPSCI